MRQNIKSFNPDFVCFSVVTDNYSWACELSKIIKSIKNIPIVFGGIQVTSCPEEVISREFIDYIVLGEGDETIVELVENKDATDIKNVWFKKDGIVIKNEIRHLVQNLDLLPLPDKEIFYKKAPYLIHDYYCMTSRGCHFNCTYCFNNYLKKLYAGQCWVRRRSVKNVIKELKIGKEGGCKHILFLDDCFVSDKEWLKVFAKEYKKKINLPFEAMSMAVFLNEEVVSLLKYMGCVKVQIGVQTPTERVRRDICKRYDTNENIENAINELKKQKINIAIDHIFSLPSEKVEDYENGGLEFYIKLKPMIFNIFNLKYYPNTEIIEIGKQYKTIDSETEARIVKGEFPSGIMMNRQDTDDRLKEIYRFIQWIPVFPRGFSRWLLKTKLYRKIPKNKYITKIPIVIPFFYSIKSMRTFFAVREVRAVIKFRLYKAKLKNWLCKKCHITKSGK